MARVWSMFTLCISLASFLIGVTASSPLVPAFLWSNVRDLKVIGRSITYGTSSSESFAKRIAGEFESKDLRGVDVVISFVGSKLRSTEISNRGSRASDLLSFLEDAYTSSKSSFALPYVTPIKETSSFVDVLLSDMPESMLSDISVSGSCACKTNGVQKLGSLEQLKAYLKTRKDSGKTELVIICNEIRSEPDSNGLLSEAEVMDAVVKTLEESKAGYIASYVTDPVREDLFLSTQRRKLGTVSSASNETFCDELCQAKASILEGLFVGITLLIILISGICCMAGITSPSRFEQAKDQ